jgi:hypothetical protein
MPYHRQDARQMPPGEPAASADGPSGRRDDSSREIAAAPAAPASVQAMKARPPQPSSEPVAYSTPTIAARATGSARGGTRLA